MDPRLLLHVGAGTDAGARKGAGAGGSGNSAIRLKIIPHEGAGVG